VPQMTLMSHSLTRARLIRMMVATAAAAPVVRYTAAQEATPVGSPFATPVAMPFVRRNAKDLSAAEKRAFTDAILAIKAMPSPWTPEVSLYDQFVTWHRDAFACDLMAAHMGPAFFPWHRMFLRLFEQQLQAVDPGVTLPYWDWTIDDAVDSYLWQPDFMGGNGDPRDSYAVQDGPFRKGNWEVSVFDDTDDERFPFLIRNLSDGELAPDLPTAEHVETALGLTAYDAAPWNEMASPEESFRNYMEGWRDCVPQSCASDPADYPKCPGSHDMHNRVHLWVSGEEVFAQQGGHEAVKGPFGTMAMDASPNDPIFFLHHANVDRIWSLWLARHGQVYAPESGAMQGHNLHDRMWPYHEIGLAVTPAMMLDSRDLGYVYDTDV